MSSSPCNKGISLIEVLIALFLVSIGILALISLQPAAWRSSSRSDFTGRAAMILQQELETNRALIMNASNNNPCVPTNPLITNRTVYTSGQNALQPQGDVAFNVRTTITDLAPSVPPQPNSWRVVVQITWPGNSTGITDSVIVGRQLSFMWPPL